MMGWGTMEDVEIQNWQLLSLHFGANFLGKTSFSWTHFVFLDT